jgi:hypothetical protein
MTTGRLSVSFSALSTRFQTLANRGGDGFYEGGHSGHVPFITSFLLSASGYVVLKLVEMWRAGPGG